MGELGNVLTRLSTGLRINSGKDDPAGLIASELLKADITGTTKAITNTERANSLIATADSSLGQVGSMLNDIKGLVVEAANTGAMSADQIAANQLQIDATIDSIDRISRTTTYAGQRLLDGSLDFQTTGTDSSRIGNLQINSANFGTADSIGVNVNVQEAARRGTLEYYGTGVDRTTTLDITGSVGTKSFTFGAGTSNADMAASINAASDSTGVTARVEGAAQRGSAILSSAGANNDIVITANEMGLDAGNYTFRITKGAENDARIVTEAAGGNPGVVEISLKESYEANYNNFAGLFNVSIDTNYVDGTQLDSEGNPATAETAQTSISITRGDANKVVFNAKDSAAVAATSDGKSLTAVLADDSTAHMSQLNGWTVIVDDKVTVDTPEIFQDNKTIRVNSANVADPGDMSVVTAALETAIGATAGDLDDTTFAGSALVNGDTLTFKGGGDAGELAITYKEGATADDILKMINNAPNVTASLAKGVDGSSLVKDLPSGKTYVSTTPDAEADPPILNTASRFSSGATSQDVIDLINSKLGDKFTAEALYGDGTGGRVSFMDSAVDYGSVNLDNALRFTGMDDGPVIRLSNLGADGRPVANQKLGVNIIQPNEADIKAGIHTPILEIRLATDASGNSITTAADIANLFDNLTPEETLGVSAELLYPPGVDPNGRVWVDDGCGNITVQEGCPEPFGLGIVQPTGIADDCDPLQNDLVMLGANESIVDDYAIARIKSGTAITAQTALMNDSGLGGTGFEMEFGETSGMNGVSIGFTTDETQEGFDETSGRLTVYIDPVSAALDETTEAVEGTAFKALMDGAIAANWEGIRAYNGATGGPAKLTVGTGTIADALTAAADGGISVLPATGKDDAGGTNVGARGVGSDDSVLNIRANNKGTDMAGIKIYFVNDTNNADLTQYAAADTTQLPGGAPPVDIKVDYMTYEDGSRALIVTGNIAKGAADATGSVVDSVALAAALNANDTFKTYFNAEAALDPTSAEGAPIGIGYVEFLEDPTQVAAQTVGGYRVDAPGVSGTNQTGTSSGIGMTGQSDDNQRLILEATEVGSEHFVKVNVAEGSFDTYCPLGAKLNQLAGTDVVATINGNKAMGKGNNISINTADLSMSMDVDGSVGTTSFTIDGGGALFQLGPNVVSSQQMRLGIGSVSSTALGGASGRLFQLKSGNIADLSTDASKKLADRIVTEAISSVATTRGRLGAIQKSSLEPNINALQDSLVALTEAEAGISNADFAEESSNLTKLQLLIQAGSQTLGIANQLPQYAASLVR